MSSVAGAAREWGGEIPLFERSRLRGNLYYKNDGSAIRWAKKGPNIPSLLDGSGFFLRSDPCLRGMNHLAVDPSQIAGQPELR
jgi:hypothetical protein